MTKPFAIVLTAIMVVWSIAAVLTTVAIILQGEFNLVWILIKFALFPFIAIFGPWWAAFAWGYWWPLFVIYGWFVFLGLLLLVFRDRSQ